MMRPLTTTTIMLLIYGLSVTAEETPGDASAGAQKAKSCMGCHNSPISLKGRGVEEIAEQIKAILDGDKDHPPGLAELREEDIRDIATYLNDA